MSQEIFNKYNSVFGIRFHRRQKNKASEELIQDFSQLGYNNHEYLIGKHVLGKAKSLLIGNLKHTKTLIIVPLDTPQKVFWKNSYYFPFDGTANVNKSLLPVFIPAILVYLISLFLGYGMQFFIQDVTVLKIFVVLATCCIFFLLYFMTKGFANKNNATRFSASIYAAYEIASRLNKEERKKVSFLFLDANKSRYYGAKAAAKYLQDNNKQPNTIILQTLGAGSILALGYTKQYKKLAQELNKTQAMSEKCKMIEINESMQSSSIMEFFPKAAVIGSGDYDKKQRLCVMQTATSKDQNVNIEQVNKVIDMVGKYLQ